MSRADVWRAQNFGWESKHCREKEYFAITSLLKTLKAEKAFNSGLKHECCFLFWKSNMWLEDSFYELRAVQITLIYCQHKKWPSKPPSPSQPCSAMFTCTHTVHRPNCTNENGYSESKENKSFDPGLTGSAFSTPAYWVAADSCRDPTSQGWTNQLSLGFFSYARCPDAYVNSTSTWKMLNLLGIWRILINLELAMTWE